GVIEEAGQEAASQGADPVDAMILKVRGGKGRSEGARGIESAAGEGACNHHAQDDAEADSEAGDGAGRRAFIHRSGEDGEHDEESGDALEDHAVEASEIVREHGRAEGYGVPGVLRNDGFED